MFMLMRRIEDCPEYFIREDGLVWSTKSSKFLKSNVLKANGYLALKLRVDGVVVPKTIHRLVAIYFIPNPELKATVNHKDGVRTNNSIDNLEWNTYSENNQHSWDILGGDKRRSRTVLQVTGINNPSSKLTDQNVRDIRLEYSKGSTSWRKLAIKYNVTKTTISSLLSGKTWGHIS